MRHTRTPRFVLLLALALVMLTAVLLTLPALAEDVTSSVELYGASVTLSDDLTLNLYAPAGETPEALPYTVGEDATVYYLAPEAETVEMAGASYVHYVLRDIAAYEMDTVFHFVTAKGTVDYSIVTYAARMWGTSSELDALLAALLHYGDAAQAVKLGASTVLTSFASAAFVSTYVEDYYPTVTLTPAETGASAYVTEIALSLGETIRPVLKVTDQVASVTVNVHGKSVTYPVVDGDVIVDCLVATSLNAPMTLTFADAEGNVLEGTATYALSNYISSSLESGTLTDAEQKLTKALAVYMQAARYYDGFDVAPIYTVSLSYYDKSGAYVTTEQTVAHGASVADPADRIAIDCTWPAGANAVLADGSFKATYTVGSWLRVTTSGANNGVVFSRADTITNGGNSNFDQVGDWISMTYYGKGWVRAYLATPTTGSATFTIFDNGQAVGTVTMTKGVNSNGEQLLVNGLPEGIHNIVIMLTSVSEDFSGHVYGNNIVYQGVDKTTLPYTPEWLGNKYTVSFDTGTDLTLPSQTVAHGYPASAPVATPSKEGAEFLGWYIGDEPYDFRSSITSDVTVTAKWSDVVVRTVTFDAANGEDPTTVSVNDGKTVSAPATAPFYAGHTFLGWYLGDTLYDFTAPITSDVTLTAKWQEQGGQTFTVTFCYYATDRTWKETSVSVLAGEDATLPEDILDIPYTWDGDYAAVTEDRTLTASYAITGWQYVQMKDAAFSAWSESVVSGFQFNELGDWTAMTYYGNSFLYYNIAGNKITAGYIEFTAIDIDGNGNVTVLSTLQISSTSNNTGHYVAGSRNFMTDLPKGLHNIVMYVSYVSPDFEGYAVLNQCYYNGSASANGGPTPYIPDTTKFVYPTHKRVIYDMDGGSGMPVVTFDANGNLKNLRYNAPTKSGYTFAGWYLEGSDTAYTFDTPVTEDITLVAKWTAQ